MQSIEYRYNNDPMVKALVDSLVSAIMNLQLTPSEIRECAMLAAIRYERSRPTPVRLGGVSEQHLTQAKAAEALPEGEICPSCKKYQLIIKDTFKLCTKCGYTIETSGKLPLA